MPHRMVEFFRSPGDGIHTIKQTVQRRKSPAARSESRQQRQQPTRMSSYASSTDDDGVVEDHNPAPAVRPPGSPKEKQKEHHHRLNFPGLNRVGHKTPKEVPQNPNASLDWRIESAPAIFYGSPEESTGALISGQLQLQVQQEREFEVETLEAKLELQVTQKKPFNSHCQDCASQKTELKSWSFLTEPTAFSPRMQFASRSRSPETTNPNPATNTRFTGTHEFPFSVLLEGRLPATTDNHLVSIQYVFTASARSRDGGLPLKLQRTIDVRRSLPLPGTPHHSVRIFPPTNITASVHYDAVVHPHATSTFTLRLDGIGKRTQNDRSVEYWKLKRLSWKLEETVATTAPACAKHAPRAPIAGNDAAAEEARKATSRSDTRVIAHADMHSGWKADYYSADGSIEAEVEYRTGGPVSSSSRPVSCDMRTRARGSELDGEVPAAGGVDAEVTHRLVVEMVVAQEYVPLAHTRHVTPTGVARILRMNFGVVLTDRGGLGVSWDNEAPPIYQDVPPSPPSYARAVVESGSVEDLSLDSPPPPFPDSLPSQVPLSGSSSSASASASTSVTSLSLASSSRPQSSRSSRPQSFAGWGERPPAYCGTAVRAA
ncbi:hypothetical protein F4777DRAFT_150150 [Nemania sp. FL0916]|nr:hypothetical protein F4777DRAFT_150150 [Nemania sp. FL0916]